MARGTTDGLHMALNIAAMLIAFLALIALADGILGGIHIDFLVSIQLGTNLRSGFCAGCLGHRRSVARLRRNWNAARHAHGAE